MKRTYVIFSLLLSAAYLNADNRDNFTGGGGASGWWDEVKVTLHQIAPCILVAEIQARTVDEAPWFTVATISNPSATGEMWIGPRGLETRVVTTGFASGEIESAIRTYDKTDTIQVWCKSAPPQETK